jgi:hypothetical protein
VLIFRIETQGLTRNQKADLLCTRESVAVWRLPVVCTWGVSLRPVSLCPDTSHTPLLSLQTTVPFVGLWIFFRTLRTVWLKPEMVTGSCADHHYHHHLRPVVGLSCWKLNLDGFQVWYWCKMHLLCVSLHFSLFHWLCKDDVTGYKSLDAINKTNKNKLHGQCPWANYTDRATAACLRSDCQLLRIKGATWSAWRIPTAVFSGF